MFISLWPPFFKIASSLPDFWEMYRQCMSLHFRLISNSTFKESEERSVATPVKFLMQLCMRVACKLLYSTVSIFCIIPILNQGLALANQTIDFSQLTWSVTGFG